MVTTSTTLPMLWVLLTVLPTLASTIRTYLCLPPPPTCLVHWEELQHYPLSQLWVDSSLRLWYLQSHGSQGLPDGFDPLLRDWGMIHGLGTIPRAITTLPPSSTRLSLLLIVPPSSILRRMSLGGLVDCIVLVWLPPSSPSSWALSTSSPTLPALRSEHPFKNQSLICILTSIYVMISSLRHLF